MRTCPNPDHVKIWDPALQVWRCVHVDDAAIAQAISDYIDNALTELKASGE